MQTSSWSRNDLGVAEYGGHGSFSSGGVGSGSCLSIDICPDLILAAIAAAAGAAVFVIYQAITVAGRKRKKREEEDIGKTNFLFSLASLFLPQYLRLEDFFSIGMN